MGCDNSDHDYYVIMVLPLRESPATFRVAGHGWLFVVDKPWWQVTKKQGMDEITSSNVKPSHKSLHLLAKIYHDSRLNTLIYFKLIL